MRYMTLTIIFGLASFSGTAGAETQKIPLDKIWAYEMPGTRKIVELDDAPREIPGDGLLGTIFKSQVLRADEFRFKDMARPGFAVSGSGVEALRAAHAVFVDKAKPSEVFSPDEEITIVFFSEPMSRYRVRITQVERKDKEIEIQYQLEPDIDRGLHENFALIPLGKVPAGKHHIEMRQLPREPSATEVKFGFKRLDEQGSRNSLCKPFTFTVTEKHK